MVLTEITHKPLENLPMDDSRTDDGAELIFHGRVRDEEEGEKIIGLDYEHYPEMAESELQKLGEETAERFDIHDLFCRHRVGRIAVGEASLRVVIWSRHRKEALQAMDWFIVELKKRVPIWKWGVTADGRRFPSHCRHE